MKNSLLKKHLILFLILIFSPLIIYNFYNPQPVKQLTPPAPQTDQFLFGAMHSWQDATDNYADYESIGLNFWHSYTYDDEQIPGRHSPMGRMLLYEDRLMTPVSTYAQKLKDSIDMLYSHNYSRRRWSFDQRQLCSGF